MGRREERAYQLDDRIYMNTHTPRNRWLSLQVKGEMLPISIGLQAVYQMLPKAGGENTPSITDADTSHTAAALLTSQFLRADLCNDERARHGCTAAAARSP